MQGPVIEELDTPVVKPAAETTNKGKGILEVPVKMKAHAVVIPETTPKEMDEILKIIRKSDYDVVEQLGRTPSKISMLALLLCSEAHAKALIKFLKAAHVPQETSADQFQECVASLTAEMQRSRCVVVVAVLMKIEEESMKLLLRNSERSK